MKTLNSNRFMSIMFALMAILSIMLLPACEGVTPISMDEIPEEFTDPSDAVVGANLIVPLTMAETATGIAGALQGSNQPLILESENLVVISWQTGNISRAFTVFGKSGQPIADIVNTLTGGQKVTVGAFNNLKEFWIATGWKEIPASSIPATLMAALNTYIQNAVAGVAKINPTILVVPLVTEDALEVIPTQVIVEQ